MKKIKITTIILAIILVTLVAFAGVYIKTQNRMENKIKGYELGRELKGGRVVEAKVVAEKESKNENLTVENYKIVKKTIEKRLKDLGAQDYVVSLNEADGTIRVELQEDANTDTYVYFVTADGKVEIKEKEAKTELLSDMMVKKSLYTYTANKEGAYQVYLELYLTDEGQAKLEEIKNNYAIFESEIDEIEEAQKSSEKTTEGETKNTENVTENKETTKKIALLTIAGSEYDIDKIEENKISVKIGEAITNTASVNNNMAVAAELTMLINSGKYPVEYEITENRFFSSDITQEQIIYFAIAIAIILLVIFIIFTIKYKMKGLLVSISSIGFISILSLLIRYTNVNITIEGIGAILITIATNLIINKLIITKETDNVDIAILEVYKEVFLKLLPIIIVTLVFCFTGLSNLRSFGMIMFWGLLLVTVYNGIVTKTLLKLKESK